MLEFAFTLCAVIASVFLFCTGASAAPLFKKDEDIPSDAGILFDGKDASSWICARTNGPVGWKVENGYMEVVPGTGCISTKESFGDCQLHVEFWLPLMADATGQARANSGVFFDGYTYEIQVLDSYGLEPSPGDCGALYSLVIPMINAARPPEQWQTYDAVFHTPRFDSDGRKIANARLTLFWNGVLVHDDVEIPCSTINHSAPEPQGTGPIFLQDHGCSVRYRNIWIRPL